MTPKFFRSLAKDFLPPIAIRALRRLRVRYGLIGDYPSWEAVAAAAPPYKTDLSIAGAGVERLRHGEQDPGLTSFPILSGILLAGDRVRILDFGGSLGADYFRTASAIPDRIEWWRVVELPSVVEYGRTHFADNKLAYFTSIDEALAGETPEVILCGGVLQYIKNPYATLAVLLRKKPHILILDRVPLYRREQFMVQRVWPELGGASLAYRILAEDKLVRAIKGYELIGEHFIGTLEGLNPALTEVRYVARVYRRNSS